MVIFCMHDEQGGSREAGREGGGGKEPHQKGPGGRSRQGILPRDQAHGAATTNSAEDRETPRASLMAKDPFRFSARSTVIVRLISLDIRSGRSGMTPCND